jgi:hypothetical protein
MTRQHHPKLRSVVHGLQPSLADLAAAAAAYDPGPLLQNQATQRGRADAPPPRRRPRRDAGTRVRRALAQETGT